MRSRDGPQQHCPADTKFQMFQQIHYFFFFFLNLNLFIFNWRIIALPYCVGFCKHPHESAMAIYMPLPHEPPSPFPLQPPALRCHRAPDLSSLSHTANFHWLSNFTYSNVYVSTLLSQFIPPSPSLAVSSSLTSMYRRHIIKGKKKKLKRHR